MLNTSIATIIAEVLMGWLADLLDPRIDIIGAVRIWLALE